MFAKLPGALALLLAAAAPLVAAEPQWQSRTEDSTLTFSAWYEGEEIPGRFSRFDVLLTTDSTGDPITLSVTIDAASADMGDDEINQELGEPDWFNAAAFPEARFDANEIQKSGAGYLATGRLRIKGVERSLEVPFSWISDAHRAKLSGSVDLSRRVWQVGVGEWSADTTLADRVRVGFEIELYASP